MSSDQSKNDEGQENYEEDFKNLECPFTWEMHNIDKSINTDYKPHDEEELILLLKLMRIIMTIFVQTKNEEELESIEANFKKCEQVMDALKRESDLKYSIDAVDYVLKSTKCHSYWNLNKKEKAVEIFKEIKSDKSVNNSTINACKSICWSQYRTQGQDKAIEFIKKALEDNQECDVYYYILGKNLRRIRRDAAVGERPSNEEKNAFLKAYEMSKNEVYGLYVAQMHREDRMDHKAIQMYEEVLRGKPKSHTVYLRLALGFIQLFKLPLAKKCLDAVANKCENDSIYHHYLGRYYLKSKLFKNAIPYLKKAADSDNYPASRDYLRCMIKIDRNFNETKYLQDLIEKYKNLSEKQMQCLLLDTAFAFFKKRDIKQSIKYFALCIEMNPQSLSLTSYYSSVKPGEPLNVFYFLQTHVFSLVERKRSTLDENTLKLYDDLKSYHKQYIDNDVEKTLNLFDKMRTT